jgi:hypothetical protein
MHTWINYEEMDVHHFIGKVFIDKGRSSKAKYSRITNQFISINPLAPEFSFKF